VPRQVPPVYSRLSLGSILSAAALAVRQRATAMSRAADFLAARYPDRTVLLTASGTTALQLAILHAAPPAAPDASSPRSVRRVALPAFGCPDLGTAAIGAGAEIVLYDTDPATLQPDWVSVERALQAGATHLVITHLYGRASDVPTAQQFADRFGAVLIEDAAQGADASLNGHSSGNLAGWSILSLGRGKGVNAGGGGVLLAPAGTTDLFQASGAPAPSMLQEQKHAVRALITEALSQPLLYGMVAQIPALGVGETVYHEPTPPAAISGVAAALVPTAFAQSAALAEHRRTIEQLYLDTLHDAPGVLVPQPLVGSVSGALRASVLVDPSRVHALHRLGVVRSYPRTLAAYPAVAAVLQSSAPMPGADRLAATTFTLPTHQQITLRHARQIVDELRASR